MTKIRNWLIYEPPGGARPTLEDAGKFVVVREGFSKAAFILAPAWLAWRRCWLALGLWAAAFALVVGLYWLGGARGGAASLLLALPNLAVGLESAWIRARRLEGRGFTLAGAATARTREEAEAAFFVDWLAADRPVATEPSAASRNAPYQPAATGVLGLFPSPSGAR